MLIKNNVFRKGFTLIELLVVVAIISLLSSVVMASLNSARIKARDVKRVADFRNIASAMELYFDKYGRYPLSPNLCCSSDDHNKNFESMMGLLVNERFLSSIPKAPSSGNPYMGYDYGGAVVGVIFVTHLEGINHTTIGPFNSCRPFDQNWCSHTLPSTALCICHPY